MDTTGLAQLRDGVTRQLTTFNVARQSKTILIPRGKTVTIAEATGHGCIAQMWMTFTGWFWQHWEPTAPVSPTILKTLILRIYWDGCAVPAIQAPVGDFFGNGLCQSVSFTSRYFGRPSGGFYCRFPMPFAKGFRIELENRDQTIDTDVFASIIYRVPPSPPSGAGYLHAQFHTGANPGPAPIDILEARGRGHLVGCILSAQAEQKSYLSFLEAPEYIFVDEDWETPRIVGTGLEDYFLGSWYFRDGPFAGDLTGVTSKNTLDSSIAMYRVHDADAITFRQRIRFQFINPWAPQRLKPFVYSSVAFYYLDSPQGCPCTIPPLPELLPWYRIQDTDHQSIP
jgi:hypothetical protein